MYTHARDRPELLSTRETSHSITTTSVGLLLDSQTSAGGRPHSIPFVLFALSAINCVYNDSNNRATSTCL